MDADRRAAAAARLRLALSMSDDGVAMLRATLRRRNGGDALAAEAELFDRLRHPASSPFGDAEGTVTSFPEASSTPR